MHLVGAFMVFGFGVLFMLLDTSISYLMCPMYNGKFICQVRLAISVLGMISLFTSILSKRALQKIPKPDPLQRLLTNYQI